MGADDTLFEAIFLEIILITIRLQNTNEYSKILKYGVKNLNFLHLIRIIQVHI